jgi:hypothetical protein
MNPMLQIILKGLVNLFFTLKYMCQFGMSLKKFNLNAKHKIFKKIHGALNFIFFTT